MAERLKALISGNPILISSSAVRAFETASIFSGILQSDKLEKSDRLYHASDDTILDVIREMNEGNDVAMIFCHNPGITEFANRMEGVFIDNVPTCGILAMDSSAKAWKDVSLSSLSLDFYLFPKMEGNV